MVPAIFFRNKHRIRPSGHQAVAPKPIVGDEVLTQGHKGVSCCVPLNAHGRRAVDHDLGGVGRTHGGLEQDGEGPVARVGVDVHGPRPRWGERHGAEVIVLGKEVFVPEGDRVRWIGQNEVDARPGVGIRIVGNPGGVHVAAAGVTDDKIGVRRGRPAVVPSSSCRGAEADLGQHLIGNRRRERHIVVSRAGEQDTVNRRRRTRGSVAEIPVVCVDLIGVAR